MRYKRAFTLIEVIVVLGLFALITSLGVIQLSFLDALIVRNELDKFSAACEYLQQNAILTNTKKSLTCDVKTNTYKVDGVSEKLSSFVSFGFIPFTYGSPGCPVSFIEKAVTFPHSTVYFYPTGILSSGTIYLTDHKKQYMYALSNAVSKVSYLRFYRYDGKWSSLN